MTPLRKHKIICDTAEEAVKVAKRLEEMGEELEGRPQKAEDAYKIGYNAFVWSGLAWGIYASKAASIPLLPPIPASDFLSTYLSPVEYYKQRCILLETAVHKLLSEPDSYGEFDDAYRKYHEFLDTYTRSE